MDKVQSNNNLCVAKDVVYNAGKNSETSVDAIVQNEGILATRSSLKVHDNPAENKEQITASLSGGIYSLTKGGTESSLPNLSLEKQNNKGENVPVSQEDPAYRTIKGKLLQLDIMFKTLPKCEIDKD